MKSFTITKNDANQRLDKFISKSVPLLPQALMYKYIRLKRIKVNGKRAEISTRLTVGDVIDMYINDEFFAPSAVKYDFLRAPAHVDIVYEDENIILLNKKVGMLCHPDGNEYVNTLIASVQRYLYEKGEYDPGNENSFAPALANRIDRNTCGIVICAKNAQALRVLNQKIKDREISKFYLCIVHGVPRKKQAVLEGFLEKNESKNKVFISNKKNADNRTILTKYTVIESKNGFSLLEIDLLTGRTHQIRAHLASIGHPLLGDGKYGVKESNKGTGFKKQALCSYKLRFDFTTDGDVLEYLNGREFQIDDVPFLQEFYSGKIDRRK
ncbi:MAG: RluA family pseudouridine synthase [Clostridia bacterium]|nr:RluA family pseudouridine synthase [Clostridia bacterium]